MQSDNKKRMVHTHKSSAVEIIFPLLFFHLYQLHFNVDGQCIITFSFMHKNTSKLKTNIEQF